MRDKKSTCVRMMFFMVFVLWIGSTVWAEEDALKFLKSVEKELMNSIEDSYKVIQDQEIVFKTSTENQKRDATANIVKKKKRLNALKLIFEELEENEKLNIEISAAYNGNTTRGNNSYETKLYGLELEGGISKGIYPHEFKFTTSASIEYKIRDNKKTISENMNNLGILYAYHYSPYFKVIAFANRFSNEELGISYRYEIGAGFDFEYDWISGPRRNENKKIKEVSAQMIQTIEDDKKNEKKILDTEELESNIHALADKLTVSNKKRRAVFTVGLGVNGFCEIEKWDILTYEDSKEVTAVKTATVSIDPEQRTRISLCPHVTIRPSEDISLKGNFDFKLPFGRPVKFLDNNVYKTDYRIDLKICVEYELAPIPWAKKMSIIGEYNYHFDKFPPVISSALIDEALSKGIVYRYLKANNKGSKANIKLAVTF